VTSGVARTVSLEPHVPIEPGRSLAPHPMSCCARTAAVSIWSNLATWSGGGLLVALRAESGSAGDCAPSMSERSTSHSNGWKSMPFFQLWQRSPIRMRGGQGRVEVQAIWLDSSGIGVPGASPRRFECGL